MNVEDVVALIKPRRKIQGISAVLMPYDDGGRPDLAQFEQHLLRTHRAGLVAAVNMDTGFGPQLRGSERAEIVGLTRRILGDDVDFVAGVMPFNEEGTGVDAYAEAMRPVLDAGATPIIFQSELFAEAPGAEVVALYSKITAPCERALGFELGRMFAPFGRIYDLATFEEIMQIPAMVGLKHSSLRREDEMLRLAARDRIRPEFKVYTGNDLAIDMVMYGSDYLLGISTFDPAAFAVRDAMWESGDAAFFEMNDALQAIGAVAFRDPVPAYKHSAAQYLNLTGQMSGASVHPSCPRRPPNEAELLAPLAATLETRLPGSGRP